MYLYKVANNIMGGLVGTVAKGTSETKNVFNNAAFWRNGWNKTKNWVINAAKGTDIKNAFAGEKPNWGLAAKGAAKMGAVYGVPAVGAYTFLKGNTNTNSLQSGTTT